MFLGNSRVALGKNFTDPVLGEWKAVAPTEATNGEYGVTGTTDYEVYCLEWVSSFNTLMVGGKFENIVSGSEVTLANSIARFDGEWKALTASTGVTGVEEFGDLGIVYAVRDIRDGTSSKMIILGGDFNKAGPLFVSGQELNFAQYSLEYGWTGTSFPLRTDDVVWNISNVIFDSSGITAFCGGWFSFLNGGNNTNAAGAISYRFNSSNNSTSIGRAGDLGDDAQGNNPYSITIRNHDNSVYVLDSTRRIRKYPLTNLTGTPTVYNVSTIVTQLIPGPPFPNGIERNTVNGNFLYYGTTPIISFAGTSNPQELLDIKSSSIDLVFYNSGDHLVVGNDDIQELSVFYNLETGNTKPIQFPTNASGTKINAVVVDQNTGTVYVGGKFVFRDSDGNTAWNVAKFIPDASKLP